MVVRNVTAVALFIGSLVAFGQDAATLTVTVVDPSAAVVPGAKITLTESQRGIVTKGETNETGFVIFNLLQPFGASAARFFLNGVVSATHQSRLNQVLILFCGGAPVAQ